MVTSPAASLHTIGRHALLLHHAPPPAALLPVRCERFVGAAAPNFCATLRSHTTRPTSQSSLRSPSNTCIALFPPHPPHPVLPLLAHRCHRALLPPTPSLDTVGRRAATTVDATARHRSRHTMSLCHPPHIQPLPPPPPASRPSPPSAPHRRHRWTWWVGALLPPSTPPLTSARFARRHTPYHVTLPSATHSSGQVGALLLLHHRHRFDAPPSSPHAPLPSQPLCSHKVPSIATSAWSESGRDPQRAATTDATAHVAPLCHHESIIVTAAASYPAHPIAGHGGSARCYHRRRHCSRRPALPP